MFLHNSSILIFPLYAAEEKDGAVLAYSFHDR
jgi:hypothetical protein